MGKLLQGFGHAFTKVADRLPCGGCAAVRARRVLTDGGFNYMIIMRVDVTDDISPEVDEVTAEFGTGVVTQPAYNRIPYEYKIFDCETGQDAPTSMEGPSPTFITTPLPTLPPTMQTPAPTTSFTSSLCVPIGDCKAYSWCDQDAYVTWCEERGSGRECPPPFCQEVQTAESTTTLGVLQTPSPTLGQRSSGTCVPSGDGLYANIGAYRGTCAILTTVSICEAYPMCRWDSSLLATSASVKRLRIATEHRNGVGIAFIQQGSTTNKHAIVRHGAEDAAMLDEL